jgi:hypothetical protein
MRRHLLSTLTCQGRNPDRQFAGTMMEDISQCFLGARINLGKVVVVGPL